MNSNLEETACLYVLDQLEPAERAAFERQLGVDPTLAALVHDLESALSRRIHSLPEERVSPDLLKRLEHQLDQEAAAHCAPLGPVIRRWGIAAAVLLAVGLAGFWKGRASAHAADYVLFAGLGQGQGTLAHVAVKDSAGGPDARFVELASLAQRYWDRPGDQPVNDGRGYAVFDPGTNQGFIAVRKLAAAPAGKRYHVWVIDSASGQAREAGELPEGGGLYFFSVPPNAESPTDRIHFTVTAEDAGAGPLAAPHGRAVLGGSTF